MAYVFCHLLLCLHRNVIQHYDGTVMFRNKRRRFVSGKVWQKYENAKRKHLKVELTADTESIYSAAIL